MNDVAKGLKKVDDYYFSFECLGFNNFGSKLFKVDIFNRLGNYIKTIKCSGRNSNYAINYCLSII